MRRSLIARFDQTVFDHAGLEKSPDEFEHTFVGDPFGNACHQPIVIDPVEELFEIEINYDSVATSNVAPSHSNRLMARTAWPKSIA